MFFVIERVFIRGIHRKDKKMKMLFESIPIPKYAFSKNKNAISLKPQVQRLMKTVDFSEGEKSCNAKTLWQQSRKKQYFQRFGLKIHLQYHIRKFDKNIFKNVFCKNAFDNHRHDHPRVRRKSSCRPVLRCDLCIVNLCELLWVGVMPRVYSDNTLQ